MPDLLRLVHGNTIGIKSLIREFREYWRLQQRPSTPKPPSSTPTNSESPANTDAKSASPKPTPPTSSTTTTPTPTPSPSVNPVPNGETDTPRSTPTGEINSTNSTPEEPEVEYTISKRQLEKKIPSIAVREKRPDYPRVCWYVRKEILEKYKMTDLRVPCEWQHLTGPLAVKRSESPMPGQNSILPPQKVVSTPAASARRIVPTKVASPTGPSVISLLQQQKARQVASGANNTPLTGAAGLLANAANEVAKSSTPLSISNQPTVVQLQHPYMVQQVPTLIQIVPTMPQITQNASVLVVSSQPQQPAPVPTTAVTEPQKPTKKVRTLDSFFGGKKSTTQDTNRNKSKSDDIPLKAKSGEEKMEVTETDSPKVTTTTENVNMKETSGESKMECVKSSTPEKVDSVKPQVAVIKDLLSKAKENRIKKQLSPDGKKSPGKSTVINPSKGESNTKDVVDLIDDDGVILLD